MTNSADPDQLASSEANWSGSTLFAKEGHIRVQQDKGNQYCFFCGSWAQGYNMTSLWSWAAGFKSTVGNASDYRSWDPTFFESSDHTTNDRGCFSSVMLLSTHYTVLVLMHSVCLKYLHQQTYRNIRTVEGKYIKKKKIIWPKWRLQAYLYKLVTEHHYKNTPIQIHWKFYYQKMKIFS